MNVSPVDWRYRCPKDGRFLPGADISEIYAPWGDRLQFDGYALMGVCPCHGVIEVEMTPVRFGPMVDLDGIEVDL